VTVQTCTLDVNLFSNRLVWSPQGGYLLVASLARQNQSVEGPVWFIRVHGGEPLDPNTKPQVNKLLQTSVAKQVPALLARLQSEQAAIQAGETPTRCEIIAHVKHLMLNHVAWDPTGRYVVTAVQLPGPQAPIPRYAGDAGYN